MAAREGARARGTDGSDFGHRETVATHYHVSAENKRRLKLAMLFHILLTAYEITKLSADMLLSFGISLKDAHNTSIPVPSAWEYFWAISVVFVLPSFLAMRKNNIAIMKVYIAGICINGILPLVWALSRLLLSGDLKSLLALGSATNELEKYNGVPVVAITTSVVTLGFITHILSVIYARNLIIAWTPKKRND